MSSIAPQTPSHQPRSTTPPPRPRAAAQLVVQPYADAAADLWRSGLGSPVPLPAGCKVTPPAGWTGAAAPSASFADVAAWVEDRPSANVAVRLADGVMGVDVDQYPTDTEPKIGGTTLAAAVAQLGPLPATFWSTSRTDGVSGIRWFRVPAGSTFVQALGSAGYGPDVEVIQRGHRYAVVAPSTFDGRTYRWVGPDGVDLHPGEVPGVDDLPELPPAWVEGLSVDGARAEVGREIVAPPDDWPTATVTHAYVSTMLDGLVTDTPPGDWHSWTFSTSCRLAAAARFGLVTPGDLSRGQRGVVAQLERAAPGRSSDEDPGREAARCWRDAVERTARQTVEQARASLGIRPPATTTATPSDQETSAVDESETSDERPASWGRIDLGTYLDGTHKPQEATLLRRTDGVALLYAGRVHSFHGESESGKSWAALVAARDVLADGGRVVMLDYESDAATVVGRLLALGVAPGAIGQWFDYRRPETGPSATAGDRRAWLELLEAPASLVVLDGVTEALATVGRASVDNDEITSWMRELPRRLAQRTGAAVVLVDHVTKDSESRGRFAIGAQAKLSALDGAGYTVEVVSPLGVGLRGSLALRVGKDRPGMVRPHAGAWRKSDRTQEAAVLVIDSTEPGITVASLEPPRTTTLEATSGAPEAAGLFRPTTLMQRVSEAAVTAGEPLSRNALAERVTGKRSAVLTAVDVLLAEGYLVADGPRRNGGGPTLRLARTYSGDDPFPEAGNDSTHPSPHDPTRTRSRSRDRGPGTGPRNGSTHSSGTGGNGSGTGRPLPPALVGVDLDAGLGKPCTECRHRVGHRAGCTAAPAA